MSLESAHRAPRRQPPPVTPQPGTSPHCATTMLLLAAFLWGSGNLANKTILADVDPASAVFLRTLIAALVLTWPAWRERVWQQPTGWLASVTPASLTFAAALLIQQWGFQTATVTNASFLVNVCCVLTPVLGVVIWRERLRPRTALAALLVMLGALLMSGAWHSLAAVNLGDGLCLISAVFYAFWVIQTGHHLERHPNPLATTLVQCLCAALVSAPFALMWGPGDAAAWARAMPEAVYLGVFATAAAFGLTAVAQTRVTASTAAILVAAESLFGSAAGILFLGERPGPTVLFGAALILTAIVVMALRPELRTRHPPPQMVNPTRLTQGQL